MGTWTAIVVAAALGAAEDSEKTQFDFDGPIGAVSLGTQSGVLVDAGKSRKTPAELSVQVQDRVEGKDATYGDTAELTAHFKARGKDVELRLTRAGFPPGTEIDAAQRPKEGVQGGVALKLPESHDGGPAAVQLWGTAEVLVDGEVATDKALVSLEAREDRRTTATLKVRGLPKELTASGEWEVQFGDAVVMVDGMVEEEVPGAALPVLAFSPAEGEEAGQTGVGGAGEEGTGQERQAPGAVGQAGGPSGQQPAGQPQGARYQAPQQQAAQQQAAQPQQQAAQQAGPYGFAAPSATGLPTAGPETLGTGGAGLEGLRAPAAGVTEPAAPAPLTGIDYGTSTSNLGPIFPAAAPPSALGAQTGPVGYPALGGAPLPPTAPTTGPAQAPQVGTPGVPGSAAASPGSVTPLSQVEGTQMSPGIPASPPVLNNGQFPPALPGADGTTTSSPGIPASNPVLNNGQSLLGRPAVPGTVTGTGGANTVSAPGTSGAAGTSTGPGSSNRQ